MSRPSCLLLCAVPAILSFGCRDKPGLDTAEDTESPYVYKDTDLVRESPPGESAESEPPEESEPPVDTVDTGEPIDPVTIDDLDLYPGDLAVFPGATFDTRLVATSLDAERQDVLDQDALYWSGDEAIATIDELGLVTALAEGEVELFASHGGLEASVALSVIAPGVAEITVVDADSGLPIEAPWGAVAGSKRTTGDEAGVVQLALEDPGPVNLQAWSGEHVPVTVMNTVSRRLVVPVRSLASEQAAGIVTGGDVDYSGVDTGSFTDIVVGLASATLRTHPLTFDMSDLVADDRIASIWGVDVALPGNLFVRSYVDDWQGRARAGAFGVWSLAGPVPIDDITAGLNGDAEVIEVLVDNLSAFSYGWSDGWAGVDGDELDIPLAPAHSLDELVQVEVPELTLGFSGDETPLVLVADTTSEGDFGIVGLGSGLGTVQALRVPTGVVPGTGEAWALAVAQVGGLGSGYGLVSSAAPVELEQAVLPAFQQVPTLDSFSGTAHDFALSSDERATLVRVSVEGGGGEVMDFCFAGGVQSGELPKPPGYSFSWGTTQWTLTALELTEGSFEGLISSGAIWDDELAPTLLSVGRMGMGFAGG